MSAEPRRFLLSNDSLVDVFESLDRDTLDVLQLTCMRFHNIVANDPESAKYCLKIQVPKARRTFFFKSDNLDELLAKCDEKMPKATYVEELRLFYVPELIERIGLAHRTLAAKMAVGQALIEGYCSAIDMRQLLDNINDVSFRAIRSLTIEWYDLENVDGRFLQHCREMGILSLGLYCCDYENRLTIDDLLDYCFGPSRQGLETTDRMLSCRMTVTEFLNAL
ncbi:hypothetical protein AAVH_11467 [Aphelenchoides avenae]|nr:hypothetical protein AAVH_11467 [Aphelenchus avenae]